jgi:arylsulfatase A-like enzyme
MRQHAQRASARPQRLAAGLILFAVLLAGFCLYHGGSASAHRQQAPRPSGVGISSRVAGRRRPNIVFVLTDDLSMDLIPYMPQVQALERRGLTFHNYFVSDSLCCPSRASIFTGDFPHDTHVVTNTWPDGGFGAFHTHGDEARSFNIVLQRAGYQTAMMGKYLNGYLYEPGVPASYVPPGWNTWDVAGWGYPEYDYRINDNGTVRYYGHRPKDYLTDVLTRYGVRFIDHAARSRRPFFLELATFAPHTPYTPAPRYLHAFPHLTAPRPPSFNVLPTSAPSWLADQPRLTRRQIDQINETFRLRVQAVQSVDDMLASIETALAADRILHNTYIVFSSDNGLHTGEYRLMPGKLTAFDTDVHVPLVIAGPGIPAGSSTTAIAENVDLADTFTQLAGTTMSSDGHSLVPLLQGGQPLGWRDAALIEHQGPATGATNPDLQTAANGNPPSYEAIRTPDFLYVEYEHGQRELYDLTIDHYELDNIAAGATTTTLKLLHTQLAALENCHTGTACWTAEHIAPLP